MLIAKNSICLLIFPAFLFAQSGALWRVHDLYRTQPPIITPPQQYLPVKPPSDATVLFSQKQDIEKWQGMDGKPTKWITRDDYFECVKGSGYIKTKQSFGDVQLHVEWAAPTPAHGKSQGRGNSGVFLMGLYEVQVLDCYENTTYPDGQTAAIYGQNPPQVNACRPPGEWQSYDIVFHRPHFNSLGRLTSPARITVFHNGILVQDNVDLWGGTDWLKYRDYEAHADKLPLSLQDHGNPVRYRNIWLRELEENTPTTAPVVEAKIELSDADLQKYVGVYKKKEENDYRVELADHKLWLYTLSHRKYELIPQSRELFFARLTAIDIKFDLDNTGTPKGLSYTFTGDTEYAKRAE
ncbi:MAG: DUF1080 domain-containing protein [Deferribacteres bacterium]|nr:DUF1080 domain-containing protein [candidate division KSB1 bacterium]MCB9501991.1 DUF1080 domain-containing protein [Deferribacteres bacterium]